MPIKIDASNLRNNLDKATSAYLLSAKDQPVHWQEWGDDAFQIAEEKDLPVLLDIGAVWCHWCHVMDKESYESEDVAEIINEHFIPVKVDRDERPDVDRRYQIFVQATGSGGGWPLTCFLTSEGKLFFGGTYFPPEDRMGKPGFKNLLLNIIKTYREKRNDVEESSDKLFKKIVDFESTRAKPAELHVDIFTKILKDVEDNFDPVYGGLGISPKFPNGSAHDLALLSYNITGNEKYLDIARIGLDNIAAGGIHDHVGGGFHRYSVDQFWHVPHFEKMTSDNAEFLKNYLHLYQVTGNEHYKKIAEGIIDYYLRDMTDAEMGGFFAYQDADISLEDDGDYFTWSKKELLKTLNTEQFEVFSMYFGISDNPQDLHGVPDRNVLYRVRKLDAIAEELKISIKDAEEKLESSKVVLLKARYTRQAPYIDKTIFADINGMMISSFIAAYHVLKRNELKRFSLKSIDFILDNLYDSEKGFAHSYVKGKANIYGLLQDQVRMAFALIDAFELSGSLRYLEIAKEVMDLVILNCFDHNTGGFFDRFQLSESTGILSIGHKPFEDVPVASVNSVAIRVLDILFALTDDDKYRTTAEKTLKAYAGNMETNGTYLSSYAISLYFHLNPPPLVIIIGDQDHDQTNDLQISARNTYRPGLRVITFNPNKSSMENLPIAVKSKISGTNAGQTAVAYVCSGASCAPPTGNPATLKELVSTYNKS
ncbi:thioredoxin domain-containing protein [candidate division KSB1 bacterium]|nr:thioredoxin domain-containing protein [candidate division KSB1 bacterium]